MTIVLVPTTFGYMFERSIHLWLEKYITNEIAVWDSECMNVTFRNDEDAIVFKLTFGL